MKAAIFLIGYFALCVAKLAMAQPLAPWTPAAIPGPYWPNPAYNHVESYHHDSTIQGNYLRGLGLAYEGLGAGTYLGAHGLIALEQARSLWLDNRARIVWPRVERRLRQELKSEAAKQRRLSAREQQVTAPAIDPVAQLGQWLNTNTGELQWPDLLIEVSDRQLIETVEGLVGRWTAQNLFLSSHERGQLKEAIRKLQAQLAARIRQADASEYTEARRLLDRLVLAACSDRPHSGFLARRLAGL